MQNALVGFTGFVGSTLRKQAQFEALYRSTNIGEIAGKEFEVVVCAGASGQKWLANRDPKTDAQKIEDLISHLKSVRCRTFILISTVDVFSNPIDVDESASIDLSALHAYGLHRRRLETFVESWFPGHLIVRLPGLVGPGLRKNVIYDILNANNLEAVETRAIFQFYPVVHLWSDIQVALKARLSLVHLTAAPISVADVSLLGFGKPLHPRSTGKTVRYDMHTRHAEVFGGHGDYQYSVRETVQAVRTYAQSEPLTR
ncbi:MAG: pyridine nucleotide transhydrogenase [Lysobacter sp.]|nr:pyridine nucleotide transhydrogenase [Lysobacter sp.]